MQGICFFSVFFDGLVMGSTVNASFPVIWTARFDTHPKISFLATEYRCDIKILTVEVYVSFFLVVVDGLILQALSGIAHGAIVQAMSSE